ncbi:MAG: Ig-like domain-containing protein [Methanobrevibacter sp.]|nr:Ig-like domain-containing protein [Methanobrevibacter sp.]
MIKIMQSYIFFITLFLILLLSSLSMVSSAEITVTGTNTTSEIQNIISSTTDDLIFEGSFDNLSPLNINRSIKISGINATITRNTSLTGNLTLFNIDSPNVTIDNLTIRGYNGAIYANTSYIQILNNQITTTGTAINITTNSDLNNIIIKNNTISTSRANAHGVFLLANIDNLENNSILDNTISTPNAHGIHLQTEHGNINNNNISGNTIKVNGTDARGVSLYGRTGVVINNSVSNNYINSIGSSSYGIYLYTFTYEMNNTLIYGNDINATNTGIRVGGGTAGTSKINNLNISYNRILSDNIFIYFIESGGHGVDNTASANWFGNNTPDMTKIIGLNVLSYYVVNATPYKTNGMVGEDWLINYTFYLNNTNNSGDYNKLPFFKAQLLNISNVQLSERIAYDVGLWDIAIEHPITDEFTIVLDYEKINLAVLFSSDKGETKLTMDIVGELTINKTVTINAVLKNGQGQTLASKNITLIINGQTIGTEVTDSNGKATFNYTLGGSGIYSFQVIFDGDDDYIDSNNSTVLTVNKITTFLNLTTEGKVEINESIKLIATLSDNNPIAGELITFKLNGEIIGTNITDTNGEAFFYFVMLNYGVYKFFSEYNGNNDYESSSANLIEFNISTHETNNTRIPEPDIIVTPDTNNTKTTNITDPEINNVNVSKTNNTNPKKTKKKTTGTKNTNYKTKVINNPNTSIKMKNSGIAIISLLILLLINLGLIKRKKY